MPKSQYRANSRPATAARTIVVAASLFLLQLTAVAGAVESASDELVLLDDNSLEALAAPVALYPDELLAIVLPAATYPLQVVQAARFLEARKNDPTLEPGEDWADPVLALLNYPEALALLDTNLDWTAQLGRAVVEQETALVAAIGRFRERAWTAGNLRSDEHQQVSRNASVIEVTAADADAVYVPYYDPRAVIVPQIGSVYYYYPNPYPLYYYPYAPRHRYFSSAFFGLTTAYTIGWSTRRINYHRHNYRSHPYYHKRYQRPYYRGHGLRSPKRMFAGPRNNRRNYRGDHWLANRSPRYFSGGRGGDRSVNHLRAGERRYRTSFGGVRRSPPDRRVAGVKQRRNHGSRHAVAPTRANNGALGNGTPSLRRSTAQPTRRAPGSNARSRAAPRDKPATRANERAPRRQQAVTARANNGALGNGTPSLRRSTAQPTRRAPGSNARSRAAPRDKPATRANERAPRRQQAVTARANNEALGNGAPALQQTTNRPGKGAGRLNNRPRPESRKTATAGRRADARTPIVRPAQRKGTLSKSHAGRDERRSTRAQRTDRAPSRRANTAAERTRPARALAGTRSRDHRASDRRANGGRANSGRANSGRRSGGRASGGSAFLGNGGSRSRR